MKQTFEEYLKEWHARDYHGTDDDMSDAFEAWLEDIQLEGVIEIGSVAMKEAFIRGVKHGGEVALNTLRDGVGQQN